MVINRSWWELQTFYVAVSYHHSFLIYLQGVKRERPTPRPAR